MWPFLNRFFLFFAALDFYIHLFERSQINKMYSKIFIILFTNKKEKDSHE